MLTNISLARLADVHPLLKARALQVSQQFETDFPGFTIQVSQGLRSWNYQAALWSRGRRPLTEVNAAYRAAGIAAITEEENTRTVTNAQPGESNHNLGFAIDWDIQDEGGVLDWVDNDVRWLKLISLAPSNGLRSGQCWGDDPHMELAEVPEKPTMDMIYTLKNAGVEACWLAIGLPAS